MYIQVSKFMRSKIFNFYLYTGFTTSLFVYFIVALNILHYVTAFSDLFSFTSFWFSNKLIVLLLIKNISRFHKIMFKFISTF